MRNNRFVIALAVLVMAGLGCICGGFPMVIRSSPVAATPTAMPALPSSAGDVSFTIVQVKTSDGALADSLKAETKKARALKQRAFVEFYADWCPPCNAIRDSLDAGDPLMVDAFAGTYIIQLDLDEWMSSLSGTGFEDVYGIPAYYELDENGKPTGRTITGDAWGDNIPQNMAPPLKAFFRANAG